jgi:uncharacterized protein YndB with AHSA1/START domain
MSTGTTFDSGTLASVECQPNHGRWSLVFVRDLSHSREQVWAALTDPAQLREWSPFNADRNLGSTGPAVLTMIDGETSQDLPGSVSRAEPPALLEYTWAGDLLQWQLDPLASTNSERNPVGSGTRLTLRHTFENRDLAAKLAAGWHICLAVARHLLAGRPVGRIVGANAMNYGFEQLQDEYARRLAAAAGDGRPDGENPRSVV